MKTIETLMKEIKSNLKKSDKIYFNANWDVDEYNFERLRACNKRVELCKEAEDLCIELLHTINSHKHYVIGLKQEIERNVLIPKIDKE